ncbi:MAG: tetratricopeptide repeat protein [Cyclobacteriaceae bacterium]
MDYHKCIRPSVVNPIILLFFITLSSSLFGQSVKEIEILIEKAEQLKATDPDSANVLNSLAYSMIEETGNEEMEIRALINAADITFEKGEIDSAITINRKALEISRKADLDSLLAFNYNNIGFFFINLGQFDSALHYHQLALTIAENIEERISIAASHDYAGRVFLIRGEYPEAMEHYLAALKIREEMGDPTYLVKTYRSLGLLHNRREDFDQALDYLLKAKEIAETQDDPKSLMITYDNLSVVYQKRKEFKPALLFSEKSLGIAEQLGNKANLARAYNNNGSAWGDSLEVVSPEAPHFLSLCRKALMSYRKGLELKREINDINGIAFGDIVIGMVHENMGEYRNAVESLKKGIKLAEELQNNNLLQYGYQSISLSYEMLGDFYSALDYNKKLTQVKDSLNNSNKNRQIAEMQTKYETEKAAKELEIQSLQLAEKDLTIERNVYMQAAMGVFIAGLIGLGFLQRSRQKHKEKHLIADEKRKMQAQQIDAILAGIEKERKRFAEDLHDGFGQYLSILRMNIDSIQSKKEQPMDERVKLFEHSENILHEMGVELKNICFNLMPKTLIQHGIDAALKEFGLKINQAGKVKIDIITHGFDESNRLTEVQEISFYRISQEWVNNILKYGQASQITLQLLKDEEEISLTIEDDGPGFDPQVLEQSKGNGWKNIQSRANLINAELELDTRVGSKGSTLMINALILNDAKEIASFVEA